MAYPARVTISRKCTRAACPGPAIATLTYVYSDSTVVLGPLATYAEPHAYDLCESHAARLTAPRGWDVVRIGGDQAPPESHDDLVALANVVRRAKGGPAPSPSPLVSPGAAAVATPRAAEPTSVRETSRRGHLRVLRDQP